MNIAVFLSNISYPLGKALFDGIQAASTETGDRLVCLLGSPVVRDRHYPMYKLALGSDIDGLIIYGGGMGQFVSEDELAGFLKIFAEKPILNVGYKVEGFNNLGIDNYSGMKEIILHLAAVHGHRNIAFVRGPEHHPESMERLRAYKDVLEMYNIPFDQDLVIPGDFSPESGRASAGPLIRLLAKKRITAAAFACDTMAAASIREMTRRGVSVPHDLAAVAFDNSDEAISHLPGLTTIDQRIHNLGREALFRMREIVRDKVSTMDVTMSVKSVFRDSCGCIPDMIRRVTEASSEREHSGIPLHPRILSKLNPEDQQQMETLLQSDLRGKTKNSFIEYLSTNRDVTDFFNSSAPGGFPLRRFQDYISDYRLHYKDSSRKELRDGMDHILHQLRVFIHMQTEYAMTNRRVQADHLMRTMNMISNEFISASGFEEIKKLLDYHLHSYKIESCGISLLDRKDYKEYSVEYLFPPFQKIIQIPFRYSTQRMIPDELYPFLKKGKSLMLRPLFARNQYWGFMYFLFEEKLSVNDGVFMESLSSQIASSLYQIQLMQERNKAEENLLKAYSGLEEANRQLSDLSFRDELTGLYNRRGFMELAGAKLAECRSSDCNFLLLYGDLDGLKIINDCYGHKEGDYAIKSIASIIQTCCRDSDIIARLGGDEFVALIPGVPVHYKEILKERLKHSEEELNRTHDKQFDISCSFGMILRSDAPDDELPSLMARADKLLYANKRVKKQAKK
ncbi:MAG: GGDEF domain-containing protein [Spirochaetales bacterium]|nr:GGDEF domain-containing protein [Spirochaetales bacterium]